ncbi:uncharacterized protein LOC111823329 isoform X2 [Myotis lucifugus]|uniref:uncharacterized protein LOC111823329 isoform X2 n=1 Tax=Myotis lucifugus TaxID=59463 RepID=UPI000CCC25CC|nr:uncharacterized protein LOC111823329 isoform X2 [Myotis lucifugus]
MSGPNMGMPVVPSTEDEDDSFGEADGQQGQGLRGLLRQDGQGCSPPTSSEPAQSPFPQGRCPEPGWGCWIQSGRWQECSLPAAPPFPAPSENQETGHPLSE